MKAVLENLNTYAHENTVFLRSALCLLLQRYILPPVHRVPYSNLSWVCSDPEIVWIIMAESSPMSAFITMEKMLRLL